MTNPRTRSWRVAFVTLGGLVAVAMGLLLTTGSWPMRTMAWDVFILLDGAWRMASGQVPHRDYSSPVGLLPQGLVALAMTLFGPSARALAQGPALVLPLVLVGTWWLCRRRFPPFESFLYTAFVTFLWVGPYPHGVPPWWTSYAMYYNRIGWSLFLMIALESLFPPRDPASAREALVDATLSGFLVGLLWVTKVNFFGVSLGLCALSLIVSPACAKSRLAGFALGFPVPLIAAFFAVGLSPIDQMADLRTLSRCHSLAAYLEALGFIWAHHDSLLIFLGTWAVTAFFASRDRTPGAPAPLVPLFLVPPGAVFLGTVVMIANMADSTIPVAGLGFVALLEGLRRVEPAPSRLRGVLIFLTGIFWGLPCAMDFTMLARAAWQKQVEAPALPPYTRLQTSTLDDLVFLPSGPETRAEDWSFRHLYCKGWAPDLDAVLYAHSVNDGLLLLMQHSPPAERILALDFINPFTVALGRTPPKGDALFWHDGRTICETNVPPAERVFAEADVVMIPKQALLDPTCRFLEKVYREHLVAHYGQRASSRFWILLARR